MRTATEPITKRCAEHLESLKKQHGARGDVDAAAAVQREIDGLGLAVRLPLGADKDRIVIWNQNNGGKGDRGTTRINLVLLSGDRVLWKRNGISVKWDAGQQTKEEIEIPAVSANKLRVEITESVKNRGGLAEVEFLRGSRNLALNASVTVSAVWENNPKYAGTKLTDGIKESYWLIPEKQEGWAQIALSPGP